MVYGIIHVHFNKKPSVLEPTSTKIEIHLIDLLHINLYLSTSINSIDL